MTNDETLRIVEGDLLVSPHTVPAWQPLKVAEVAKQGSMLWVRIPSLQKQTQLPGGWMLATALFFAPVDAEWDKFKRVWKRDGQLLGFGAVAREVGVQPASP